jgi:hypothetical protein
VSNLTFVPAYVLDRLRLITNSKLGSKSKPRYDRRKFDPSSLGVKHSSEAEDQICIIVSCEMVDVGALSDASTRRSSEFLEVEVEVEVKLRLTVSRPVCLGVGPSFRAT